MAEHRIVCSECGIEFLHTISGAGRKPVTCSAECKTERTNRRARELHKESRGEAFFNRLPAKEPCLVEECDRLAVARGLCGMHYARLGRIGTAGPVESFHDLCTVDGCLQQRFARGWCDMHYQRAIADGGDPGEPERRKRRRGGRDRGYVTVTVDGKRMAEHRFVMEQQLGRKLYPEENVHHRNGRRDDNDPSNLELWVKPQTAGQRVEDLVAWVIEHYPQQVATALESLTASTPLSSTPH